MLNGNFSNSNLVKGQKKADLFVTKKKVYYYFIKIIKFCIPFVYTC